MIELIISILLYFNDHDSRLEVDIPKVCEVCNVDSFYSSKGGMVYSSKESKAVLEPEPLPNPLDRLYMPLVLPLPPIKVEIIDPKPVTDVNPN